MLGFVDCKRLSRVYFEKVFEDAFWFRGRVIYRVCYGYRKGSVR